MDQQGAQTVLKVYRIIFYVLAAIDILGAIFILIMGTAMNGFMNFPSMVMSVGAGVAALFLIIIAILLFVAGNHLQRRTETGRILTIIISIILLFSYPIGTIIGALGIYFFAFEPAVKSLFRSGQAVVLGSPMHTRKKIVKRHKASRRKRRR